MFSDADSMRSILVQAGLLSDAQFEQIVRQTSSASVAASVARITEQLVSDGYLTEFQAEYATTGRWDQLVIGDYLLRQPIKQGGMGQVYEAWHLHLQRIVAMKSVAAATWTTDATLRSRFEREVRACGRLNHPNIVTFYDAIMLPRGPWLVMERLQGRDLTCVVRQDGPLPPRQAITVVHQAACGLAHAHQCGVLHRDVKPANLFLESTGRVRVLDFGLALLEDRPAEIGSRDEPLTASGVTLGTAEFMAPEQAVGSRYSDERSDIYSLGCTFYFLLTAQIPYNGSSFVEQVVAHREQPTPHVAESIGGPALTRVVRRMMAKAPELRQQTMNEVVEDLSDLAGSTTTISAAGADVDTLAKYPSLVEPTADGPAIAKHGSLPRRFWLLLAVIALVAGALSLLVLNGRHDPPAAGGWNEVRSSLEKANPGLEIPEDAYGMEETEYVLRLSHMPQLRKLVKLDGIELDSLYANETSISDLTPLAGSKLTTLEIGGTRVTDLTPLAGMSLRFFAAWQTRVSDIEPLRDMPLWYVDLHVTPVSDLSPLANAPLEELDIHETEVEDLSFAAKLHLLTIDVSGCRIDSLEAISHCPLQMLWCDPRQVEEIDIKTTWPHLKRVNDKPVEKFLEQIKQ